MIFFQMEIRLTVTSVLTVRGYIYSIGHRHMIKIVCRDPVCGMELKIVSGIQMIFAEAGPGWSKLVISVVMMNDGVVIFNAWIKSNTSFTICSPTKGLQNSWNKDKEEYTGAQAWLKLSKDRAFSIIGLAVHDLAVMAESVISGLKPPLSLCPHIAPPPQSFSSSAVCVTTG